MNYIPKMKYSPVLITDMEIPIRANTRPGLPMEELKGIIVHNTGCPGVDWYTMRKSLLRENHIKNSSYNDVMGFDAQIYRFIPLTEISYTSGSFNYTQKGKDYYNSKAWMHTHDMEVCTAIRNNMTNLQVENIAKWGGYHCVIGKVDLEHFERHMDIALDKPNCPEYLKGLRWKKCKSMATRFYDIVAEEAYTNKECSVVKHAETWDKFKGAL